MKGWKNLGPSRKSKNSSAQQDRGGKQEGITEDDDTVLQSGNPNNESNTKKKASSSSSTKKTSSSSTSTPVPPSEASLEQQVSYYKDQIAQEKAGKRKLFHSLVKLANELRKTREHATPLVEQQQYLSRNWYEGGFWRAPQVLPAVTTSSIRAANAVAQHHKVTTVAKSTAVSLSDLFFNLVIVTAFTRVGVAVSETGTLHASQFLYFAVFWTVWSKEASYSTRFDTTDLSATFETLVTCFAVLFASLSVHAPVDSVDGSRIMIMAASVALLHVFLHARVWVSMHDITGNLARHIRHYAVLNMTMNAIEAMVWMVGMIFMPLHWRWIVFTVGVCLALRVPRAFLANDFHAACSKRGVLFILLLGFELQSIVVVASEFFEYQTPTLEHYSFIGAACLMFFCIKLLYVEDSHTMAGDHALLVNRLAGFFFNLGQFCLLLSTTIMGSGLNLLTHDYLAATAALPGPAKNLVCGGYSAVLLSICFIKSMHLKRVPTDPRQQALFVGAYVIQTLVLLAVVGLSAAMCFAKDVGGFMSYLMNNDIQLLFSLCGAALFVVMMSWLDEGVELALYESAEDSREYLVAPFGFWRCLRPEVSEEEVDVLEEDDETGATTRRLSALSPLLGESAADLKRGLAGYDSLTDFGGMADRGEV